MVYAGVHVPSFERASQALQRLAELPIPTKQVERLTQPIGQERCQERAAAVAAYTAAPLVQRQSVPAGVSPPAVAVVQIDGGRLQVFDRRPAPSPGEPAESVEVSREQGYWREDKVGLLASMSSVVSEADPCPEIPPSFVDPLRMLKLAREIKGAAAASPADMPAAAPAGTEVAPHDEGGPKLQARSVVATRQDVHGFGPLVAAAAWVRGFYGASRRAFVADGAAANWGVWERHFSNFTPLVDFIHALSYVFHAALAGQTFAAGWPCYTTWIGHLWAGKVEPIIEALLERQAALGAPAADEPESSPRWRVAEALSYLQNQQGRMRYADYRRAGLPITSSHIESTIRQMNQRVKGTEKFWSPGGAEAILQMRADVLSDDEPLGDFWQRRQARATGQRSYRRAA